MQGLGMHRAGCLGRRAWWAGGVALLLILSGCQGTGGRESVGPAGPPPPPVQHPMLKGIPLPTGFKVVPERSAVTEMGAMRVGQCELEGYASPEQVLRFFETYLPTAKFKLQQKRYDSGEYAADFESDSELCTIRVRTVKQKTVLTVKVQPLGKGADSSGRSGPR